jgi:membrane dipeptidase
MKTRSVFLMLAVVFGIHWSRAEVQTESERIKIARSIHQEVHTVDTHVDTPMTLFYSYRNLGLSVDKADEGGKVDFVRMKEGGLDSIFFAVFTEQRKRTLAGHKAAKEKAFKTFSLIKRSISENQSLAELALSPKDAYDLEKKGKRAIFIGIENGYPIGRDLSLVETFYHQGARYITLCHTKNNDICDSSTDTPEHGGLSGFGEKVVREMNRLGMLIDVSHISDEAFYDVLQISKTPVFASHSCARALCDNPRNLTDDMIKALAEKKGVIQVCFYSGYVKKIQQLPQRESKEKLFYEKFRNYDTLSEKDQQTLRREWQEFDQKYPKKLATVSDMVDHIDHIVKLVGDDYVGIGTDFDGGGELIGCRDVSEMANVTIELVKRGYTKEQIQKIWAGNFMRFFSQVQAHKNIPAKDK